MERHERVSISRGSLDARARGSETRAIRASLPNENIPVTWRAPASGWKSHSEGQESPQDYTPCIYISGNRGVRSGGWKSDGDGDPGAPVFSEVCGAQVRTSPWNTTSERVALATRYHPRVRDLIADPRSREERRGTGAGARGARKGGTRGETRIVTGWRHGSQESAIARTRGAPRGSRRADMLPAGTGECARCTRHTREIYSRGNAIDAESPANGRRAKTEPTEEEKPGPPRCAAATTATATSPPATRRAENIRGEWRTLPARSGGERGSPPELCAGA